MMKHLTIAVLSISIVHATILLNSHVDKRSLQKSHEKSRISKLSDYFLEKDQYLSDPDLNLVKLLNEVAAKYFSGCSIAILYDNFTSTRDGVFLNKFMQSCRLAHIHVKITSDLKIRNFLRSNQEVCMNYIIFVQDVIQCQDVVSKSTEKVVVVTKSTQWRVQEYLYSDRSQEIANLLIITKSIQQNEDRYILYSHKLFVDALGSSQPVVIASWNGNELSRNTTLFETKLRKGFSGHRFIVATAHQPPYVISKGKNRKDEMEYTGIEIKLIDFLASMYNFSTDYKECPEAKNLGAGEAVIKTIAEGSVNLGIGGVYLTEHRYYSGIFHWHSEDCAAFVSLASTALPRYRAIMGPFRWSVWLALIAIYLTSIPLFSYADKRSLKHLFKNPQEFENMFWYVFGTFTNCFTFSGRQSWTRAPRGITKILVGIYWLFTIIITACYTGSIIAFVTLPVFPAVIDTIDQLLRNHYDIGMLDKGGWPIWFQNITDKAAKRLMKKIDFVPDVESGLKNVTKAFFWPYAFLGSRDELYYIVRRNFSTESKKSLLHISQECLSTYKIGILMPNHSVYSDILGQGLQRIVESGFDLKIKSDIEWELLRSATGKLLAANGFGGKLQAFDTDDRALTLDDTQGMFLLLLMGFLTGAGILASEVFGGCFNWFKRPKLSTATSDDSIPSNPRYHDRQTNRHQISILSKRQNHHCVEDFRPNTMETCKSNEIERISGLESNNQ